MILILVLPAVPPPPTKFAADGAVVKNMLLAPGKTPVRIGVVAGLTAAYGEIAKFGPRTSTVAKLVRLIDPAAGLPRVVCPGASEVPATVIIEPPWKFNPPAVAARVT